MKVLFTHSYFLKFDAKQYRTGMPYPPLGTLFAMSHLRAEGFDVRLFDNMFSDSARDIRPVIDAWLPDVVVSYDDGFNYLTKMCLTNMREACFDIQAYARSKGCRVVTSSSDSADHYEQYLKHGADFIVIGEGEQTLLELCAAFRNNTDATQIRGIAYIHDDVVHRTAKRQVIRDLDSLPPPAWDLLEVEPYRNMWLTHHGYFSINFVTTRGCPYKCNWCAKPIYGNRYNSHGPENSVKTLKKLQQDFGFTHVWFADDIFGLKPGWVTDFALVARQEGLNIRYKIQSRADLLIQEKYVEALATSGCNEVWLGAESGSQKILDAMDKGTTVEQIRQARAMLKQHGVRASFFLQFGYPGEDFEDIKKTINLVRETMPDDIGVSVSYPLPGTVFYERVKADLQQKTNWTDSDEMAMMFSNMYPPRFYKLLHRFTHSLYRKQRAVNALAQKTRWYSKIKPAASYIKYWLSGTFQALLLKQKMT